MPMMLQDMIEEHKPTTVWSNITSPKLAKPGLRTHLLTSMERVWRIWMWTGIGQPPSVHITSRKSAIIFFSQKKSNSISLLLSPYTTISAITRSTSTTKSTFFSFTCLFCSSFRWSSRKCDRLNRSAILQDGWKKTNKDSLYVPLKVFWAQFEYGTCDGGHDYVWNLKLYVIPNGGWAHMRQCICIILVFFLHKNTRTCSIDFI